MRKGIVFAAIVLFGLLALATPGAAESKSFYFPEVRIDIAVAPDGSFSVDEFRTFEFRGSYTWASLWIPLGVERRGAASSVAIEDFAVLDDSGAPLRLESGLKGGRFEAKWYYQARNERRTFHIRYRVRGGVVSHSDVTELYWQPIGPGWDRPTRRAVVTVTLPGPVASRGDLLIYGHGPLSGVSEIVDLRTARFTAENIVSGQFLEVRVIWPAGLVQGHPSDGPAREAIRNEETLFVQDTIARAMAARESEAGRARTLAAIFKAWLVGLVIVPLLWLAFFIRSWKVVGRDYKFPGLPDYVRDPPSDIPPAMVELLRKEGIGITPASFTATIFDLARRGYVAIEDRTVEKRGLFGPRDKTETTLTLRKKIERDASLKPFERDLGGYLFGTVTGLGTNPGSSLTIDELKTHLKKHPAEFQKWYKSWTDEVKREGQTLGFVEPASIRRRNLYIGISIPLAILTLNPILAVFSAVLVPKMKRRTVLWARENEGWKGLERFLDDFSEFKDLPPEAYKLWERYLVFGILFGNAKNIIKALPIILADERAAAPVWYTGIHQAAFLTGGGLMSMVHSIESMATTIQQASTSAAHYSSGGGGGFSSGGGGGGGGGGGSAG